jgi:plasmid stability protein
LSAFGKAGRKKEAMMRELKVNLDEKLLQRIHRLAKTNGRSFDQEVEAILRKAVPEEEPEFDRLSDARRIAAMTPKDRVQTDSTILVRQERGA